MIRNAERLARTERHGTMLDAIAAGIDAAHPRQVVGSALRCVDGRLHVGGELYALDEFDDVVVLGGGNAAGHVAAALESTLGERIDGGLVITDQPVETEHIEVVEGTHPLPSEANVMRTRRLLDRAERLGEADLAVVVVAGGASALVCAPHPDVPLAAYRTLVERLLARGASISDLNAVRKHLSTVKGGLLARTLSPARTVGLVLSDVVGDPLDVIASGPTAPDESTYENCLEILQRYDVSPPEAVRDVLQRGVDGGIPETPGPTDDAFERVSNHVLANGRTALDAATGTLSAAGYSTVVLAAGIEGEAREVGAVHAAIARECSETGAPFEPPVGVLSGGETTVTVDGAGEGGPNLEFALGCALGIDSPTLAASVDTDGIDGTTSVAGALVDGETVTDADRDRARAALRDNDALTYLAEESCTIETGPTGTNVNDLRIVLVGEP